MRSGAPEPRGEMRDEQRGEQRPKDPTQRIGRDPQQQRDTLEGQRPTTTPTPQNVPPR
jgi:hypothetical protein